MKVYNVNCDKGKQAKGFIPYLIIKNMAKKAQKVKKGQRSELLIVNPDAAGIDVASTEYQVCVPEDRDENHNRRFDAFTCDLRSIVEWLKVCRIKTVAMEATGIYWVQLFVILEENGFDVIVCNAKHIKNLGEKKTDYVDAGWIQLLHTYGLLTESFQPENKIREIKDLARSRERLIERCNQSLLRVQKSLDMMNIKLHKVLSDIKGQSGMAILQSIAKGEKDPQELVKHIHHRVKATKEEILKSLEGNWSQSQVFILKQNLDCYLYTQGQIQELDLKMEELMEIYIQLIHKDEQGNSPKELIRSNKKMDANNAPAFDAERYSFEILGVNITRIPGISGLTALKVVSELGAGFIDKFPTPDKFCCWANLTPNTKKSGGKVLSSKVPKRKNHVGQILRVAANTLKSHKGYLGNLFKSKRASLGYNQAIVAVAHKLARILYKMVKDQVEYNDQIETQKNILDMQKRVAYYEKKAQKSKNMLLAMAS
jgi:transposase